MKVGFDISAVTYQRGVSRYTSNLLNALTHTKGLEMFAYGSSLRQRQQLRDFLKTTAVPPSHQVIQRFPPTALSWMWRFGLNPVKQLLPQIEVFHSWDWLQPPDRNIPLVSTIHDLAMLHFPEVAHPQILKMHQRSWKELKDRKAHIIAVSQATKRDIVEMLDIPAKRVKVVYEALPAETLKQTANLSEEKIQAIKQRNGLDKPFILFVGTREPRKNLERLIKAWKPLSKKVDLVIAGASGWDQSHQFQNLDGLKFLGHVSGNTLATLYSEAELLAYPSLYEGFGLPILEAFHFGTPVLTSNTSSMPEVAGNAAELVNPNSIEDISAGLQKILEESTTDQKKRLQKMIIRLHAFSWDRVAEETKSVYQTARDAHLD